MANRVFIGGCSRSGTTFLADQIGRALDYAVIPESQFKEELLRVDFSNNRERSRAIRDMQTSWRLSIWGIQNQLNHELLDGARSVPEIMDRVVEVYRGIGEGSGRRWIDHTPTNVNCFPLLRREFPEALFVHLVRDPRAVWASVRSLTMGPNSVFSFVNWWTRAVANGVSAEIADGKGTVRVRYEDFCLNSEREISRITKKLCLEEMPSKRKASAGFAVPAYTRHQHRLVGHPPQVNRIDRWKEVVPKREIEIIEFELGPVMQNLGYENVSRHPRRGPKAVERFIYGQLAIWPKHVLRRLRRRHTVRRLKKRACV
jgi:hypothetical protein